MKKQKIEYVFFNTDISEESSVGLLFSIQRIIQEQKEPRIVICSSGGCSVDGILIHDQIKLQWPDIIVIGSGTMQSAALDIFLAAKKENRYITEHCSIFIHEMFTRKKSKKITFSKRLDSLGKNRRKEFIITRDFGIDIFSKNTGFSKKAVEKLEKRETWIKPKKIIELGLASKIITSLDEI